MQLPLLPEKAKVIKRARQLQFRPGTDGFPEAPQELLQDVTQGSLGQASKLQIGGYQNYGPFLGPYYNTAPNI